MCTSYSNYLLINANDLILDGLCNDGCQSTDELEYYYSIFYTNDSSASTNNWVALEDQTYFVEFNTKEMIISSSLFTNLTVNFWKVNLVIVVNGEKNGSTSVIFKLNKLPRDGSCSVNLVNGTAMLTYFTVYCKDWIDDDGFVKKYEYFGNN